MVATMAYCTVRPFVLSSSQGATFEWEVRVIVSPVSAFAVEYALHHNSGSCEDLQPLRCSCIWSLAIFGFRLSVDIAIQCVRVRTAVRTIEQSRTQLPPRIDQGTNEALGVAFSSGYITSSLFLSTV